MPDLDKIVRGRLSHEHRASQAQHESDSTPENIFESKSPSNLQGYSKVFEKISADDCRSMGEEYMLLTQRRRKRNTPFFTDKSLSNFGHVGLIQLILPNAKIIDARRHPLDCGWSCFTHRFAQGMRFSYRLQDIGQHYANYVRLMTHFDRVLPGRMHRVVYEDLVADPDNQIRRLFEFLELPFEEGCLRFYENKRIVSTLSSEQVRMPLYKTGVA